MKVKALRVAAYLLIANFVLIVGLSFTGHAAPDYGHLLVLLCLLVVSVSALFSPRKRGWLAIVGYAGLVVFRHGLAIATILAMPSQPLGVRVAAAMLVLLVDSPMIAALVLVFRPASFAAFSTPPEPVPSPRA